MGNRRYCMACDLKDDQRLIEEYKRHHLAENTWPEITDSMREVGIIDLEIYLTGNRLVLVMEVDDSFEFNKKAQMDAENLAVREWEQLMWRFQQMLPWAKRGEKWVLMEKIFKI